MRPLLSGVSQLKAQETSPCCAVAREALWDAAQTALSRTIEQALATSVVEQRAPFVPLPVASEYLAGAFLNLLKWWLEAEIPYSPEQMDAMFQQLALPGVWATLEGKNASPPGRFV